MKPNNPSSSSGVPPKSTRMLTPDDKQRRIQWAQQHQSDDFTRTISTEESSFKLFCSTVRRWTKHLNDELKCISKNRQKFHV